MCTCPKPQGLWVVEWGLKHTSSWLQSPCSQGCPIHLWRTGHKSPARNTMDLKALQKNRGRNCCSALLSQCRWDKPDSWNWSLQVIRQRKGAGGAGLESTFEKSLCKRGWGNTCGQTHSPGVTRACEERTPWALCDFRAGFSDTSATSLTFITHTAPLPLH